MFITSGSSGAMSSVAYDVLHPMSSKGSYTLQKEVIVVKRRENGRLLYERRWQLRDAEFDMGQGTYRSVPTEFSVPDAGQTTAPVSRRSGSSHSDSIREQIREVLARGRKEPADVPREEPAAVKNETLSLLLML